MADDLHVTERSRLRRYHERGAFDRETVYDVLDAQPLCSVGYTIDGDPFVTPTLQWRIGDRVYWHGSSASRALRRSNAMQVCLSVAILDGFVLARSGMHHSVNSRSVTLFGTARQVTDPDAKQEVLHGFLNGLFPGRYDTLRPDTAQELKATMVLSMTIEEGSAKLRSGGPVDDDDDYDLPIWAGVIPIATQVGAPVPDPRNLDGVPVPEHVKSFAYGRALAD
ncbi:MAG: pyridoxamine 5'-phosphate oxidase family protein [Pseudomonadota bacterium]